MPTLLLNITTDANGPTRQLRLIVAAIMLTLPTIALCSSFVCKPPGAGTIIRDTPPPECSTVDIREINSDGTLKRIIAAPLTEEQKKAKADKEKRLADCHSQNQDWSRAVEALLTRYKGADDIEEDRDRELAARQRLIDWQEQSLRDLQRNRVQLAMQEEFRPSGQLGEDLKRSLASNNALRGKALRAIEYARDEMNAIDARYDATVSRYSEIVAGTAKPPLQCEE
jgi:hypothetical protein